VATTLPTFHDIPQFVQGDLNNPASLVRKLEALREQVQLIIGTRGPGRGRTAWFQQMLDSGLLDDNGVPIDRPPGSNDDSPPPMPEGLTVTPAITRIFVEWTPPTYYNGGGNALTTIYGVSRDPADPSPPPTFANAVKLATVPFGTQIIALPTEPHVKWHIWITFTSYANQEGPPAGGTNGATCISDQLNGAKHIETLTVTNALIASCGVDKLVSGSINVGEYIQSSGFVSGALGFRISGNGNAEFNNAIFRGLIETGAGRIGGAIIDASGVKSANYVAGSAGWRLDNTSGSINAFAGLIGGAVIDSSGIESDNYTPGTSGWRLDNATGKIYAYDVVMYGQFNGQVNATGLKSPSRFVAGSVPAFGSCWAGVRYNPNGTIETRSGSGGWTAAGNWYTPTTTGIGSSYNVMVSARPGANALQSSEPLNAWRQINVAREFYYHIIGDGSFHHYVGDFDVFLTHTGATSPDVIGVIKLDATSEP
jgi:hypothetical protein